MKSLIKKSLLAGLFLATASGSVQAACKTGNLGGVWDFTFNQVGGVGYCKGLRFARNGSLKTNGSCDLHEENNKGRPINIPVTPVGGMLKLNTDCSLNTSQTRYITLKSGSETFKLKVNAGRMSKDQTSMIMYTSDATGKNRYSHVWHGVKK